MDKLLKRLRKYFKEDEINWEGVEFDHAGEVLHIVPFATVVTEKGTYIISFIKDAFPNAVANIIRLFERNGLRYELYEHFRWDDEKEEMIWESDDPHFWKKEEPEKIMKNVKQTVAGNNIMYG